MSKARIGCAGLVVAVCVSIDVGRGTAAPVPAERLKAEHVTRAERLKTEKELAVVSARLHGAWECPCEGRLELRPDGTYAWTDIAARGGLSHHGHWSLRGNPAAPTLVMHCTVASTPKGGANPREEQGRTTEWKFAFGDEGALALEAPRVVPFYREERAK